MSVFSKNNGRCDFCSQMDYRNHKLKEMLFWLIQRIEKMEGIDVTFLVRQNPELETWYDKNKKSLAAEQKRIQEEMLKTYKKNQALAKLTDEEKELLGVKV